MWDYFPQMKTTAKTRMVTAEVWLGVLTLHQKTKTKLESLLHFYVIKEESYEFLFSDKRKLHFKWRQTLSKKKRTSLIRNVSFCQRKCGVKNLQPAHFCFLRILMGLNFLFQIEERDLKSPNHTLQLPIICQSIFPSVFFHCIWLVCFYLDNQE